MPPTAAEMFGAVTRPIAFAAPEGFRPCNPSILWDGWQWICSIRTVDYELGKTSAQGSSSRNFLATLTAGDLETDDVVELEDRSSLARHEGAKVRGFEDLRLVQLDGKLCALATACDLTGRTYREGGWGTPEMVLLATGKSGVIWAAHVLRGPWSTLPQKNWMPLADGSGRAIYRLFPTLVMDLAARRTTGDPMGYVPASVRGGSQLLPFEDGYLGVVHESTRKPLAYRHRFVWLDRDLAFRRVSDNFVWLASGVEFCAGMASDGRRLVASFGVADRQAHLAVLDPARVRAKLRPVDLR